MITSSGLGPGACPWASALLLLPLQLPYCYTAEGRLPITVSGDIDVLRERKARRRPRHVGIEVKLVMVMGM